MGNRPWYKVDPSSYESERQAVLSIQPELPFGNRADSIVVSGDYLVTDGGRVLAKYEVEIILPRDTSRGLPTVLEIGGRIPRTDDRHINGDGTACIMLPDAYWFEHPEGLSLSEFVQGPMQYFFANQALMEIDDEWKWPAGEWSHGIDGIVEFYGAQLSTHDRGIVTRYVDVLRKKVIKGHWQCPCGSGAKIRDCHRPLIESIRERIPIRVAEESYRRLRGRE
jgi:hypothetical protein